jgi:hypothetical protein
VGPRSKITDPSGSRRARPLATAMAPGSAYPAARSRWPATGPPGPIPARPSGLPTDEPASTDRWATLLPGASGMPPGEGRGSGPDPGRPSSARAGGRRPSSGATSGRGGRTVAMGSPDGLRWATARTWLADRAGWSAGRGSGVTEPGPGSGSSGSWDAEVGPGRAVAGADGPACGFPGAAAAGVSDRCTAA